MLMGNPASLFCLQVERQRRLERIKQKQSQLQELILQVVARLSTPPSLWKQAVGYIGLVPRETDQASVYKHS